MVMVLRRVCVLAEAAATPAGQHNTTTIVRQKNCANELHTQALGGAATPPDVASQLPKINSSLAWSVMMRKRMRIEYSKAHER
jgi:hypothetical protein